MLYYETMKYLNALNSIEGLGPQSLRKLLNHCGSGEHVWGASRTELLQSGVTEKVTEKIIRERLRVNPDALWDIVQKEHIEVIPFDSPLYPALLKEIPSCPYLLYAKGNTAILSDPSIAIVGSRSFTAYGKMATEHISQEVARAGICIVSGLAFGVDALAHHGALLANGKTIAILGNSLDDASISPRANFTLSRQILASGGLLVSEFAPRTQASKFTFPMRNRIIAGISLATLVIEAAEKSGSLITANYALEFNRDVFAVPGSIFSPQSEGANNLIKRGAKLVGSVNDILEELRLEKSPNVPKKREEIPLSQEERVVLSLLSHEPVHVDSIIKLTTLDTSQTASMLTMLEIKGVIRNIGGQNYVTL